MNFMIIDLTLLALFAIFVGLFLYRRRKEIKKEGLLLLYHAKWGIRLIDKIGKKYEKPLNVMSYVSVYLGYILMAAMIYFFGKILFVYFFQADIVRAIKLPPIMPLIPYLPKIFKLSFLPPFYFSYWIVILAIIAMTHEFFHGIFAKISGVKTKTTGFGFFPFFLPVFLAAFVNLDEEKMQKIANFKQRAILSAGTFANVLTTILAMVLMAGLFLVSFSPAGVVYDDYAYSIVNVSEINSINGNYVEYPSYESLLELIKDNKYNEILTKEEKFFGIKGIVSEKEIALYHDAPAIRMNLTGAISKINGEQIDSLEKLSSEMEKYSVGERVTFSIYDGEDVHDVDLVLEESPKGTPWIGITFFNREPTGIITKFSAFITSYKKPNVHYLPKFEMAQFIYDFLWWLVLISFSVALVNMLPVGIFDGGRFFYLTILSLTKSEKIAKKAFSMITMLFLILVVVLMFFWARSFF